MGKEHTRARRDLYKKVQGIAAVANILEITAQSDLIDKILRTDYIDNAGKNEFEHICESLRDMIKFVTSRDIVRYTTKFDDEILSMDWNDVERESDDLENYRAKAEFYISRQQTDIFCKSNSGVYSSQWADERFVGTARRSVYRYGKRC